LLEGAVYLAFELAQTGQVRVYAEARDVDDGALLTFSIDADQTYLPLWRDDIRRALDRFPSQF
jgi:hypothetical protein